MSGGASPPGCGPMLPPTARCDMSTPDTFAETSRVRQSFVFPDPPEDPEDQMTNYDQMAATGNTRYLAIHLGNPETTLVVGERYLALAPTRSLVGVRYPDLLVAFGVDPAAYYRSNAYVISDQGKPPDLLLEVASRSSGHEDTGPKRGAYAALGIGEYWRFDETGRYHGTKLAGDRLVDGEYVPIAIEELDGGSLQGYSAVLNVNLRWEPSGPPPYREGPARGLSRGLLGWYGPATGRPITTLEDDAPAPTAPRPHAMLNAPAPTPSRPAPILPRPASGSWKNGSAARGREAAP